MKLHKTINVKGTEIALLAKGGADYISLTDIAKYADSDTADKIIQNWMRARSTIDYLGLWEKINNLNFKPLEFEGFKSEAGSNSFILTPQRWIKATNAIGLISKSGRYGGGTFAHRDIAFEFASWLSPEFKLYLIKEFQRLKEDENQRKSLDWDLRRSLAKINYRIHTDAIKEHLIPRLITNRQAHAIYASEADILNMALFGMTAKDWRTKNPDKEGNIRDYATVEQLVVLSNLESLNALWVEEKIASPERLVKLNKVAISQMRSLLGSSGIKRLWK
jgi:hypothetical protein